MNKDIYLLGVGHNTPVCIDLAEAAGLRVAGLYHYSPCLEGVSDYGVPLLGCFDDLLREKSLAGRAFMLTMGLHHVRQCLTEAILARGGALPTIVHPLSMISRFAHIEPVGVQIHAFTAVQAGARVGRGCTLLTHVNLSHHSSLGEGCFVAGGSMIGAYVAVGEHSLVGQGAVIVSGKCRRVGAGATIGAGAVVVSDVAAGVTVAGVPATAISH